jgi:hypothetical protein
MLDGAHAPVTVSKDMQSLPHGRLDRVPLIAAETGWDVYPRRSIPSFVISLYGAILVSVLFYATTPAVGHWFLIPVTLCGAIIGIDAVDWMRGKYDLLDPIGLLGVFGIYFFYVAPILHVQRDFWIRNVVQPDDWRTWIGYMAWLNVAGILAYRLGRTLTQRRRSRAGSRSTPRAGAAAHSDASEAGTSYWRLNYPRFIHIALPVLFVLALGQVLLYASFGGIVEYMLAATAETWQKRRDAFQGLGFAIAAIESFPIIFAMVYVMWLKQTGRRMTATSLVVLVILMIVILILFGGLRGNRGQIIFSAFWAIGLVHFTMRKISRRFVAAGCVLLVAFVYLYGFYKGAGPEGVSAIIDAEQRQILTEQTNRGLDMALLWDLGRSDIQAYVLYRVVAADSDYQIAYGRTYIGALAYSLPRQLFPGRPPTKVKEGTEILRGAGAFEAGMRQSLRVYGLAGETMLNFGPAAIPIAFALFGVGVGLLRRFMQRLSPDDARWLIVPILINLVFTILVQDSDVVFAFVVFNLGLPLLIVWLASEIRRTTPDLRHSPA